MTWLKTLTYKTGSTLISILIAYAFIGRLDVATGIGILDLGGSTLWYYYHEKFWAVRIQKKVAEKEADRAFRIWNGSKYKRRNLNG
jgi:uncharacterized membrane protein